MKTFYIYEVVGHKIGVTTQLEKRNTENFNKYQIIPIILETYEYPDTSEYWKIIGDREWELADIYGYNRGVHYKVAREARIKGANSKKPRIKIVKHTEEAKSNMRLGYYKRTDNIQFKRSSAGGKTHRKLTDEQINEIIILKKEGSTLKELSKIYNVSFNTISRRCRGINYKL